MLIHFYKYQGTGNDFILIDNRTGANSLLSLEQIQLLCSRKFGVGADGLICIEKSETTDFRMNYFNSDGSQSFCGNGGRCAVAFAAFLGMIKDLCTFEAIDGLHEASISNSNTVVLKMGEISEIEVIGEDYFIHTGSPHYVHFKEVNEEMDVITYGKSIRYNSRFQQEGTNVNIAEVKSNNIVVETYERGVEDETLSCGTGVTAVALIDASLKDEKSGKTNIVTKGGQLIVHWEKKENGFQSVFLEGPAIQVYEGRISI
jgi:diaminopimelate epimerase